MFETNDARFSDYDRLQYLMCPNPFLPPAWPADSWDLPADPLAPRERLWDEAFAPRWDSHPPVITPKLGPEEWAAWHMRGHNFGLSVGRAKAIAATVAELMRTE